MTEEVTEEKSNLRLKTDEEKAKDQRALSEAYNRVILASSNFFEHYGYCEGDYGDIGMRHYDQMKDAHDRLVMPKERIGQVYIVEDWNGLTEEERKTSSSAYWYENE
jgi:hypothetical protein